MRPQRLRVTLPAIVAFGSNLGDREQTIRDAVAELDALDGIVVDRVSSLYESAAVKPAGIDLDAPRYLNGVASLRSALHPHELLSALQAVEQHLGRVRQTRWGDRTIDLDLITFAGLQQSDETLILPHPLAFERPFVLVPWHEIEPGAELPGRGPIASLLAAAMSAETLRAGDLSAETPSAEVLSAEALSRDDLTAGSAAAPRLYTRWNT